MQATFFRHQLYSDERFESLTNSGRSLSWAYELKALKSAWYNLFNTCDEKQFYITKMMMLITSDIVMCSFLYSVCLVSRVLKNTYSKEHLSVIASKYNIYNMENKTYEFTLGDIQKVRSLKIPEFWPSPPSLLALVRFWAPPSPTRTYVRFGKNSLSPPQFLYLWNLEKRN